MNPDGFTLVFRTAPQRRALGEPAEETSKWVRQLRAEPILSTRGPLATSRGGQRLARYYTAAAGDMGRAAQLLSEIQNDPSIELAYIAPPRHVLAARTPQATPGQMMTDSVAALVRLAEARALPQWNGPHAVSIAIVDSGCDPAHAQLKHIALVDHLIPPLRSPDTLGHGSHVAGLVAALAHEGNAFQGLSGGSAQITLHRCLTETYVVAAYYRALVAATESARLINLSLGGEGEDPFERDTIGEALDNGAIVVAAAGNDGEKGSPINYPAAYPNVLAVAAVDADGNRAEFSNEGDHIFCGAPGVDIVSTVPTYDVPNMSREGDPPLGTQTGTSMATPIVTGLIARMLAWNPHLSRTEVFDLIRRDSAGWNPEVGWGVINAHSILATL